MEPDGEGNQMGEVHADTTRNQDGEGMYVKMDDPGDRRLGGMIWKRDGQMTGGSEGGREGNMGT